MSSFTYKYYIFDANSIDMVNVCENWQNSTDWIYKELLFFSTEEEAESFINENKLNDSWKDKAPVIKEIGVLEGAYQLNYYALEGSNAEVIFDFYAGHYLISSYVPRALAILESEFYSGFLILPNGEKKEETIYVLKTKK